MGVFKWQNKYNLGLDDIDAQHMKIITYMNRLANCVSTENKENEILQVLDMLKMYSLSHFAYEESILDFLNYPDIAEHENLHAIYCEKLDTFYERNKVSAITRSEILVFLRSWLINHIMVEDRKYIDFIKQNNILF